MNKNRDLQPLTYTLPVPEVIEPRSHLDQMLAHQAYLAALCTIPPRPVGMSLLEYGERCRQHIAECSGFPDLVESEGGAL